MRPGGARLLQIALFALTLCAPARAEPLNARCPVQPEREADERFVVEYQGRRIAFCCEECVDAFGLDPDAFLDRLPGVAPRPVVPAPAPTPRPAARATPSPAPTPAPRIPWTRLLVGAATAVAGWLLVRALFRRRARGWRRLAIGPYEGLSVALVGLLATLGWTLHSQLSRTPPAPPSPSGALAPTPPARPPTSRDVYYRGNDERSPRLQYGGVYRTATITLTLCGPDQRPIEAGVRPTQLHLQIERAPFTANLFGDRIMSRVCLTPDLRRRDRRVPLTRLVEGQRWEARVPLAPRPAHGRWHLLQGELVHYVIRYVIEPTPNVWMGAVFYQGKVPLEEWLSRRPLPLRTRPHRDPRLTGEAEHK